MSSEIVKLNRGSTSALSGFEPENMEQAMRLAAELAKSTLLPAHLRGNPSNILLVMMRARQLGVSMFEAFQNMHVVDGKTGLGAELMAALVQRNPVCEFLRLVESTDQVATYEAKRRDHAAPIRLSYTMKDATQAGLTGRDNWKRHPKAMLRARCISALIRANFQDCLSGVYEVDELRDISEGRGVQDALPMPVEATTPAPAVVVDANVSTSPPPAPVVAGKRTAELKAKLAKLGGTVAVQAIAPPAPVAVKPSAAPARTRKHTIIDESTTPDPPRVTPQWVQVAKIGNAHGLTGEALVSAVKGATGKQRSADLTDDDVETFRAAMASVASPATVPEPPEEDGVPFPTDADVPPEHI